MRHVYDLKKLISLNTLDSTGCNYKAEGGFIQISRRVMVVMKGKREHGLYALQGTTVTGLVAPFRFWTPPSYGICGWGI